MRLSTRLRILRNTEARLSLRERIWAWQHNFLRFRALYRPGNAIFRRVFIRDFIRFLAGNVRPVKDETRVRAERAAAWLQRAQAATPDDGVSLGLFPCDAADGEGEPDRWRSSYPETTGYIIQSLVEFAARTDRKEVLERARDMARWEAQVQMPSGAVQGGPVCEPDQQHAAVFNTGMVLQGWTELLATNGHEEFLEPARRAADFLAGDLADDGHFRTHGPFVSQDKVKTYNCLCAWALYRFGHIVDEQRYRDAAVRSVAAAVKEQNAVGWYARNCLDRPDAPLTHTIGYSAQGIFETGLLAGRDDFIASARRCVDAFMTCIRDDGFVRGRFYDNWQPACFSSCLTGNAQMAIVCYRLFEQCGEPKYRQAADRLMNFLQGLQQTDSGDPALDGAIAGSHPVGGDYMTYGYPNWATKYLLDGLLLQERLSGASTS